MSSIERGGPSDSSAIAPAAGGSAIAPASAQAARQFLLPRAGAIAPSQIQFINPARRTTRDEDEECADAGEATNDVDRSLRAIAGPASPPVSALGEHHPLASEIELAQAVAGRAKDISWVLAAARGHLNIDGDQWQEWLQDTTLCIEQGLVSNPTTPQRPTQTPRLIGPSNRNAESPPPRWYGEYISRRSATPSPTKLMTGRRNTSLIGASRADNPFTDARGPNLLTGTPGSLFLPSLEEEGTATGGGSASQTSSQRSSTRKTTRRITDAVAQPDLGGQGTDRPVEHRDQAAAEGELDNGSQANADPSRPKDRSLTPVVVNPAFPKATTGRKTKAQPAKPTNTEQTQKRRRKAKHNVRNLMDGEWEKVYEYALRIVGPNPANPRVLAHKAMQHLLKTFTSAGPEDRNVEPEEDVEEDTNDTVAWSGFVNEAVIRPGDGNKMVLASLRAANTQTRRLQQTGWEQILEWIILVFVLRRATSHDKAFNAKKVDPCGRTLAATDYTRKAHLTAGLRWIALAHALGDLAFLPLLLPMGDIARSLSQMGRLSAHVFGALTEFLQTGEDGRDERELWETDSMTAMRRNAARFAVKWILPTACASLATMLNELSRTERVGASVQVRVGNRKKGSRRPTTSGCETFPARPAFPINLQVVLTGCTGTTIGTPPTAVLSTKYKTLLRSEQGPNIQRRKIDYLCDRSVYDQVNALDKNELESLLPCYNLVVGMSEENANQLQELLAHIAQHQRWPVTERFPMGSALNYGVFYMRDWLDPEIFGQVSEKAMRYIHNRAEDVNIPPDTSGDEEGCDPGQKKQASPKKSKRRRRSYTGSQAGLRDSDADDDDDEDEDEDEDDDSDKDEDADDDEDADGNDPDGSGGSQDYVPMSSQTPSSSPVASGKRRRTLRRSGAGGRAGGRTSVAPSHASSSPSPPNFWDNGSSISS